MEEASIAPLRYIQNPDVVLREEDPDGGLLFNPDTNQIRVLNATGLFVWKLCDGSLDLPGIVLAIEESFDGVPEGRIAGDVGQFVEGMQADGFIGIIDDEGTTLHSG